MNCSYSSAPLVMFVVSHLDAFECIKKWNCSHCPALHWGLVEAIWMHWQWYILIPWAWDTPANRIIFCVSTTLRVGESVTLFKRFFVANIYREECQPILNSKPFTTYSGKYHTCKTRNWTCICNIWTILGITGRY